MSAQTIKKNAKGYGYKYADLSEVNEYIAGIGETYRQYVETVFNPVTGEPVDYIHTIRIKDEQETDLRGCRVINAELANKANTAQEQGSGLTYARRYSLYMAYGLATEDDDAASFDKPKTTAARGNGTNFDELKEKYSTMSVSELRHEYAVVKVSKDFSEKQKTAILNIITKAQEAAKE